MARPKRDGLHYFSFDTDFFDSDKRIKAVRARYGCDGLLFHIYLLAEIYRNGYYVKWDGDSEDGAMSDLNLSAGFIKQVISFLVSRSLLSSILIDSDTVLTSPGIQRRYQEAVKGLKRDVFVDENIWLLEKEETASYIKVIPKYSKSEKNRGKSEKNRSKSEKNGTNEMKENKTNNNSCPPDAGRENAEDKEKRLEDDFEKIYAIYPKKVGRTVAFANYKLWLTGKQIGKRKYKLTNKQMYLAVNKYVDQQYDAGKEDFQYWKNFDTLMGRQLLDFVDDGNGG